MGFLEYLSLAILLMGLTLVFYGFIFIHDIPYVLAKKRQHPHAEAIHIACWVSLFTLHAIWPIVFIWAATKQQPFEVSIADPARAGGDDLARRLAALEQRVASIGGSIVTPNQEARTND